MSSFFRPLAVLSLAIASALASCGTTASYTPPGRGADLRTIAPQASSDVTIEEALQRKPAAGWPATIAVVRVQAPEYRSTTWQPQSSGSGLAVVSVREVEKPEHLARVRSLPNVRDVTLATPLLFPARVDTSEQLRLAAAQTQADLLLVYTFDTVFRTDEKDPLLAIITLGIAPTQIDSITSTAQCVLLDVRSGFFYGSAEATERTERRIGSSFSAFPVDSRRLVVEGQAFEKLLGELERLWPEIVARHATPSS